MDLRSQALAQLEAGEEKPYLDEEADRDAAAGYYGDLDPKQDGALAQLLERTHRDRPPYNPATELYPWVDLQPDGKIRSLYTDEVFEPEKLIERYEYQIRNTYPNRIQPPATPERTAWKNIRLGLIMLRNIFWQIGVLGDYKRVFWKFAFAQLRRGNIESFISVMLVAHHLIIYARAASVGRANASNYSLRMQGASVPAE